LLGLLKTKDGHIKFDKEKLLSGDLKKRNSEDLRSIQLIFQNPDESLNPNHTVEQILSQPLKLYFGLTGSKLKASIAELLEKVRLGAFYMSRYPRQLSGGEKQRNSCCKSFCSKTRYYFM
jgi:peptide/nickel transport system ATP-binding protein